MRRSQRTFRPDNKDHQHVCLYRHSIVPQFQCTCVGRQGYCHRPDRGYSLSKNLLDRLGRPVSVYWNKCRSTILVLSVCICSLRICFFWCDCCSRQWAECRATLSRIKDRNILLWRRKPGRQANCFATRSFHQPASHFSATNQNIPQSNGNVQGYTVLYCRDNFCCCCSVHHLRSGVEAVTWLSSWFVIYIY